MTHPGSRRGFMRHLGIGSAAALGSVALPATLLAPSAGAQGGTDDLEAVDPVPPGDVDTLNLAAGLEAAASQACREAVARRLLTSIDEEHVRIFGDHHLAHADSLVATSGSGEDNVSPDPGFMETLTASVAGAADGAALLAVIHQLEEQLAATHLAWIGQVESNGAATALGRVLPVDGQQATVLGQALGLGFDEWLPNTQTTDGALDLAAAGA